MAGRRGDDGDDNDPPPPYDGNGDGDGDDPLWWLRLSRWLDFVVDCVPLVASHTVLAPMSGQALASWSIPVSHSLLHDLMFVRSEAGARPWSVLTYMAVHESPAHVLSNLIGALSHGSLVHRGAGPAVMYSIFVAGGVAGALDPLALQELQWRRSIAETLAPRRVIEESVVTRWFPSATQWWVGTAAELSASWAPSVADASGAVGSSAGVAALAGASAVVVALDLASAGKRVAAKWSRRGRCPRSRRRHHSGGGVDDDTDVEHLGAEEWAAGYHALQLASILGTNFFAEAAALQSGESWRISHAGHLSGFVCGVVCMAAVTLSSRPAAPRTGRGRRLDDS